MPISGISPDQVWSEVDLWLDIDVFVARFCDGSDAPLHVLSVEFELYFGDVVVVLLDGLWIACALLVGDGLAGRRGGRLRSAWCFAMPLHARFYMDDRTRYEGTFVISKRLEPSN